MPLNIELKARLADIDFARSTARNAGAVEHGILIQTDTYFRAARGRLKLREIAGHTAELIFYERPSRIEARRSRYRRVELPEPAVLREMLEMALGVFSIVRKRRELWLLENVRIHLDEVEDLGTFVELEAIVDAKHDEETCHRQIDELSSAFAISATDLVAGSYGELVQPSQP